MTAWQTYLANNKDGSLEDLVTIARIPSISALPEHKGEVQQAAEWVAHRLEAAGIEGVRILPTAGQPVVYGEWLHAAGKPTILIYGHFDVQPVDPVELWTTAPFSADIRDGRLYARGAADMKGTLVSSILAVEAWLKAEGRLPVNVKFLLEGEEEIGSPDLPEFVAEYKDLFACDLAVSADGGQFAEDQPSLPIGLRGLCKMEIDVYGANSDLHSGLYGGAVQNPIHALVRVLDSLRSPDGKVLVAGFYDEVTPLSEEDRERIAAVPFDEESYKADLGVDALFGEPGYTPIERVWARPTLEINGIWGGFQGAGAKTVIPREAHAKITCRLVPDQDPLRIGGLITHHVQSNAPAGVRVEATMFGPGGRAYRIPADHPGNQVAASVLREIYGKEPYYEQSGGSVPICELLRTNLGVYTVGFGFALDDEHFHAPNEFWRLSSFDKAQRAWGMLLDRLGDAQLG